MHLSRTPIHWPLDHESAPRRSDGPSDPTLIAGRYTVLDQIGSGATGTVFRAVDRLTGRVVTVKRLRLEPSPGPTDSTTLRFTLAHEFRMLAALRHPPSSL